jgi:8-oxo-dGTP pyrophosphatase MutT (NUDIX family)
VRWTVHGERPLYESPWVRLALVDVEIPGVRRFDHHVVRVPQAAAGTVVSDPERGVLLIWRHRFITDTWGYEIPAGRLEPGESPADAAAREVLEETGWRPSGLRPLISYHPTNGLSDQRFHLFIAGEAEHVGDPTDETESERIEWVPEERVAELARDGSIGDGLSLTAILYALSFGYIGYMKGAP